MTKVRVLGVHGLGHQEPGWFDKWQTAVAGIYANTPGIELIFEPCNYDDLFDAIRLSPLEILSAAGKLAWSGLTNFFRRDRGLLGDVGNKVNWTAGYVVAWTSDKDFQRTTRDRFLDKVRTFKPDIILAHSLGSEITYNAISDAAATEATVAAVLRRACYVTFGSQINNPFVVGNLSHGRVQALAVRQWRHLYNQADPVFTAQIRLPGVTNFAQIITFFDKGGFANHDSPSYIAHPQAIAQFWQPYAADAQGARDFGLAATPAPKGRPRAQSARGRNRALLVGINDYIDPANRLEGCVNDVFAMSAVLQECGFDADDIRACLDRRATAQGILERLEWLLDDIRPEDERVFFYSGHGAQMPVYGPGGEPDRVVETLVPCDFDWSPEKSITDEHIYGLYSQLPYDTRLAMIFDCCHSGGIHRQGGARPRGLTPPDDIRHRQLKWDSKTEMWVDRRFERVNRNFSTAAAANRDFFGAAGDKLRLGRAGMLRREVSQNQYRAAKSKAPEGIVGPYLPLIIEACGENQLSYEYRHGATSYGAFTFALTSLLRRERNVTFADLVRKTRDRLVDLQYDQTPQILGPGLIVNATVPWQTGTTGANRPPSSPAPGV